MIDLIYEIFLKAGPVLPAIFLLSVWAWFLIAKKVIWLRDQNVVLLGFKNTDLNISNDSFFGKLVNGLTQDDFLNRDFHIMENKMLLEDAAFKDLKTINACAVLAPLLGLLGTVTGMEETFTVIQLFGGGNPAFMADGISEALLTTQGGLIVAFPLVMAHTWLKTKVDALMKTFAIYCVRAEGRHV